MDYQQHRAARRACQGSLSRAAVSARRTAFAAPPHPQGGGAFRAPSVSQGGRFSPRHRIRKAVVSRRVATPKAAGFPCAVISARRPAFAAPPHPQGGGFSVCGPFRKRRPVFVALPFLQGGGFPPCGRPKAAGFPCAVRSARRRVPCARPPKAAGFPCAVRSARRPAFAAPPYPRGGGFSSCGYPQSGRLSVRGPFRKAAGFRRAIAFARRRAFRARPPPRRRAFRARSVPQGGGLPSCGHHAGRLALAAPAGGGAAPPFSPLPAPRRRYTRRVPTCRTGTPTARSRDKASGSACPRCGRRGNIGPVPRRSTSFSPPLGPWGGASLSMPGRNVGNAESG